MKHINYQKDLGTTEACTDRIMEATKRVYQKSINGGTEDCFIFDSWFAFKRVAEDAMEVGAELIGMVKTNTKGLIKDTI